MLLGVSLLTWTFFLCHTELTVVKARNHGNLRLVGSRGYRNGKVEIYIEPNNTWGIVCDDHWDDADARVVCRQLGFGNSGTAVLTHPSPVSFNTPIWLDDVDCTGHEQRLIDCPHNGLENHNCGSFEDAGVTCTGAFPKLPIRLVEGTNTGEGRVEISYKNSWATVCDDGWDDNDASAVCRQLGLGSSGSAVRISGFGQGNGTILLDEVRCTTGQSNIFECRHNGFENHNCSHIEDAGVRCNYSPINIVRLVRGNSYNEGRVEVNHNGQWGTVCDDGWDDTDAGVVCRQLGFGSSGTALGSAHFGQGSGSIWLDSVICTGNESTLASCGHLGVGVTRSCSHSEDAGVRCSGTQVVPVRLSNSDNSRSGRVEMYINGEWGTVCDDHWTAGSSAVICRQLGLGSTGTDQRYSPGPSHFPILLDDVICVGNEANILACQHLRLSEHNCNHGEDIGVTCSGLYNAEIRLVNGANDRQGRVEIMYQGIWGTICDDGWDDIDATVVCRELGYSHGNATRQAQFGSGTGSVWLRQVGCTGSESKLSHCTHTGASNTLGCSHAQDVGVQCAGVNVSDSCAGNPCEHTCITAKSNYICQCRKNYFLAADNTSCIKCAQCQSRKIKPTWHVTICNISDENGICSGTAINDLWVLTSAGCVCNDNISKQFLSIRFGKRRTCSYKEPNELQLSLSKLYCHPGYDPNKVTGFDLALIKLQSPIHLKLIRQSPPLCLTSSRAKKFLSVGKQVTMFGLGSVGRQVEKNNTLMSTGNLIISRKSKCKAAFNSENIKFRSSAKIICTVSNTTESCKGDYGSAVIAQHGRRKLILGGIVSKKTKLCGTKDSYLAHSITYGKNFKNWIKEVMAG